MKEERGAIAFAKMVLELLDEGRYPATYSVGKTRRRVHFYACTTRWNRGASICGNDLVVPTALAEDGVLSALEQQFMHPEIITRAMAQVRAALTHSSIAERPQEVARELTRVNDQLERVIDAVQNGGGEVGALIAAGTTSSPRSAHSAGWLRVSSKNTQMRWWPQGDSHAVTPGSSSPRG